MPLKILFVSSFANLITSYSFAGWTHSFLSNLVARSYITLHLFLLRTHLPNGNVFNIEQQRNGLAYLKLL